MLLILTELERLQKREVLLYSVQYLLYILNIYIFVLTVLLEEVLASAYLKQMTTEEQEKSSKLDED